MTNEQIATMFLVALMALLFFVLHCWSGDRSRVSVLRGLNAELRAEIAALRSQISQRDSSGRFAKKNAS